MSKEDVETQSSPPRRGPSTFAKLGILVLAIFVLRAIVSVARYIERDQASQQQNFRDRLRAVPRHPNEEQRRTDAEAAGLLAGGRPFESRPFPSAHGLSAAELRYCVAQKIRLDAATKAEKKRGGASMFSSLAFRAGDFKSECRQMNDQADELLTAEKEIAPFRKVIEAEGIKTYISDRQQ